jgi:two-component sensor histidine kinase/streptogramin lyase
MGTENSGIYRIYGNRVEHFGSEDGLSSNTVTSFYQDREGDVWVATSKGLDCFRDRRVLTFSTSEGLTADLAMSVLATTDGKIWIGNKGALDVLDRDKVSSIRVPGQRLTSLFEDRSKRLWVGVDNTLAIYHHGRFEEIKRPDGSPLGMVVAMTEDREQNLWASVTGTDRTLFEIRDGHVQRQFAPDQIPKTRLLAADPTGGIWLGLGNANLGHYRNGKLETIPLPQSMTALPGLTADRDGSVWASTKNGMVHWKQGESKVLTSKNGLPCDGFFSSIRDNQGTLWMNSACGLIGIPDSELGRWWEHPDTRVQFTLLDVFDGAMPGLTTFQPALAKSPDGRLWFVNDAVLQMFDPSGLRVNRVLPPVYVERMTSDGKNYPVGGLIRLPPRSRNIEIGYTALSYAIPQKVRFRYKLEGRDADWQDAGSRREAFYNDLPPGQYHFHVSASSNDGVWNTQGATLNFWIDPAYYQTSWFRALIGIAGLMTIAGLYWLRLYWMRVEFNAHLEGRVNERLRVARELHDTLLQTFQASLVQMQAARNLFTRRPEQAVENLDSAIKMAAGAIAEGRGAIQQLRPQPAAHENLAQLLTITGEELARSYETTSRASWRVAVEGEMQELQSLLQDEIYRITRELLRNAFQHAQAKQIETEIRYEPRTLRVLVRDDGKGIDPAILQEGGRAGHWGFTGMSERAKQIGARLDFWSEAGVGTEVQLTVPASIAYLTPHKRWRLPLVSRNGGSF